jgi:ABC-type Fe3+-hydroxamate transport system substrate-binding protein
VFLEIMLRLVLAATLLAFTACSRSDSAKIAATSASPPGPTDPVELERDALVDFAELGGKVVKDSQDRPRYLVLNGQHVTDQRLSKIHAMKELTALGLNGTAVTDNVLTQLDGLNDLSYLFLNDTEITDRGLPNLRSLARLRYVSLKQTQVTRRGVEQLAQLAPGLDIDYSPREVQLDGAGVDAADQQIYRYRNTRPTDAWSVLREIEP